MSSSANRYEIFLKVVELGNITRAAEALHYTQSGVSHAVRAIERECGVTLLTRGKTGVSLTASGRQLLPRIQAVVNDALELERAMEELSGAVGGTIRIGTFTSVSMQWLPGLIRSFQETYPRTEFEVYAGGYEDIAERIAGGSLDCGFLTSVVEAPALDFKPLKCDQMMAVLPKGHPLSCRQSVPIESVRSEEFVMPLRGSERDIREALGGEGLGVRYALGDDFSAMAMVESGFGMSVMSDLILQRSSFELDVRPLDPPRYRTIGIATPRDQSLPLVVRTFVDFLLDQAHSGLLP